MKISPLVFTLCAASCFSLHSMNIVLHRSKELNTLNKIHLSTRHCSTSKKLLCINTIAGIGGIILTQTTGDPLFLLPIIPHALNSICTFFTYAQTKPTQFEQDLEFLIDNKPHIIDNITYINSTTQKIDDLRKKVSLPQVKRFDLIEQYEDEIAHLEQNRINSIHDFIKEISPLFKTYNMTDISDTLKNYKKNDLCLGMAPGSTIAFNLMYLFTVPMSAIADVELSRGFIEFLLLNVPLTLKNTAHICDIADRRTHKEHYARKGIQILECYNQIAWRIKNTQQHSNNE